MDLLNINQKDYDKITTEITVHSQLDHPNIIELIDYTQKINMVYMILEFAEKGTLFSYMNQEGKLSKDFIAKIFVQVCRAVEFIHGKGFIHRDIKPENILLDKDLNAKLSDFGLCVSEQDYEARKQAGGTFEYMSPEGLRKEMQGKESDIWALGILLYEMFHDSEPFVGESREEVLHSIGFGVDFDPATPADAQDLIKQLLSLQPQNRPSIREILNHRFIKDNYHEVQGGSNPSGGTLIKEIINRGQSLNNGHSENPYVPIHVREAMAQKYAEKQAKKKAKAQQRGLNGNGGAQSGQNQPTNASTASPTSHSGHSISLAPANQSSRSNLSPTYSPSLSQRGDSPNIADRYQLNSARNIGENTYYTSTSNREDGTGFRKPLFDLKPVSAAQDNSPLRNQAQQSPFQTNNTMSFAHTTVASQMPSHYPTTLNRREYIQSIPNGSLTPRLISNANSAGQQGFLWSGQPGVQLS